MLHCTDYLAARSILLRGCICALLSDDRLDVSYSTMYVIWQRHIIPALCIPTVGSGTSAGTQLKLHRPSSQR
jgi:hypothetical protein